MTDWILILRNGPDKQLRYGWFYLDDEGNPASVAWYPPKAQKGDSIYFQYLGGSNKTVIKLSGNPPVTAGDYSSAPASAWKTGTGGNTIEKLENSAGTPFSFTVTIGGRKVDPQMNVGPSMYGGIEPET